MATSMGLLMVLMQVLGCKNIKTPVSVPTPVPGITAAVQWKVTELTFTNNKTYNNSFNDVDLDVIFTHSNGTELKVPAFWDGGNTWKVRFSPTIAGNWTYKTVCSDISNTGLNKTGNITCSVYTGDLYIYKHGFIKTISNTIYFTYDDGTPFFYLGDTHWSMPSESFDSSSVAGIASQFKYIIDKRVQQGFTVYQSEPIGARYNLSDGFTRSDLAGFADLDRRFKYIADAGLVHANAQLVWANEFQSDINGSKYSATYIDKLCRYWVARYSAYPVLWTTAQEVDASFYGKYDVNTNPWKTVLQSIYKYDPYRHPSTAHQENVSVTRALNSSFKFLSGYKWFAAQWSPAKNGIINFAVPKEYWNYSQGKPVVNYEGHYDHLWTNEYGARTQVWTAYLNGMYGHGYGAEDIWLYNSTYNIDIASVVYGITITVADKKIKWYNSVNLPSAYQMGYAHSFFNSIEWWNLTPRFDSATWFINNGSWYSVASENNDLYVAYFYNNTNRNTGTLKNLANVQYTVQWYNPISDTYNTPTTVTITDGSYTIHEKPDNNDWVLLVKKS